MSLPSLNCQLCPAIIDLEDFSGAVFRKSFEECILAVAEHASLEASKLNVVPLGDEPLEVAAVQDGTSR